MHPIYLLYIAIYEKKTIAINIGPLPTTFTKLGDNLPNNGGDILTANSNST